MRVRRKQSRRREPIVLNLASMIDVTFLLLLYFLVTTVLAMPEDRLSPTLRASSQSAAGPDSDFQPQIVEVRLLNGAPAYRLGTEVFHDRRALTAALEPLHKPSGLSISTTRLSRAAGALRSARMRSLNCCAGRSGSRSISIHTISSSSRSSTPWPSICGNPSIKKADPKPLPNVTPIAR